MHSDSTVTNARWQDTRLLETPKKQATWVHFAAPTRGYVGCGVCCTFFSVVGY